MPNRNDRPLPVRAFPFDPEKFSHVEGKTMEDIEQEYKERTLEIRRRIEDIIEKRKKEAVKEARKKWMATEKKKWMEAEKKKWMVEAEQEKRKWMMQNRKNIKATKINKSKTN